MPSDAPQATTVAQRPLVDETLVRQLLDDALAIHRQPAPRLTQMIEAVDYATEDYKQQVRAALRVGGIAHPKRIQTIVALEKCFEFLAAVSLRQRAVADAIKNGPLDRVQEG